MFLKEVAELRTLLLLVLCYASIAFLLLNPLGLFLPIQMLLLIPLITLHSSIQHEFIHGHPFNAEWLNDLLVLVPVGVYLSYHRFKESHLAHHDNKVVSDPHDDPESWYLTADDWAKTSNFRQNLLIINNTLVGRILLGPAISSSNFICKELFHGTNKIRLTWFLHFVLVAAYLSAIGIWTSLPIWAYIVCCYFGLSLLGIRTFLEHQAHQTITARTVVIEQKGFFIFLFLNNNLHAVHHAYPKVAWYRLPSLFERNRMRFLGKNKGYYFRSYFEVFSKFAIKAKEPVIYPLQRKATD